MRSIILFISGLLLLSSCKPGADKDATVQRELSIYNRAVSLNDPQTAIMAMHNLIEADTARYAYYDTLATLYYGTSQYISAIHAARQVLKHDAQSERMLKLAARSCQFAGAGDQAVPFYLKLAALTGKPEYDYHLAFAHYEAGQFIASDSFAQKALRNPQLDSASIVIFFGQDNQMQQQVPLKAAAWNVLGMSAVQQDNVAEAKDYFTKALALYPDFLLARQGVEYIDKYKQKNNK